MKVPPSNSMNGFNDYDDDHYFNDGGPPHNIPTNGNGVVEDYSPPVADADFSEYMWMENEEEFDKEVLQRLEEEELMEQCMLQHMLDDEHSSQSSDAANTNNQPKLEASEMVKSSTLNPYAAEFIPTWGRTPLADQKSS